MVIAGVLALLLAATALSLRRPAPWSVGLVGAAGIAWWLVNGPVEGIVLVEVTPDHGLTTADLLVPPLVAVAVLALVRRDRRTSSSPGSDRATGSAGPRPR